MFFRGSSESEPGSRKRTRATLARSDVTRHERSECLVRRYRFRRGQGFSQECLAIALGAPTAAAPGPVIASRDPALRNTIRTYPGGYAGYRALAIAARTLPSNHRPHPTDT